MEETAKAAMATAIAGVATAVAGIPAAVAGVPATTVATIATMAEETAVAPTAAEETAVAAMAAAKPTAALATVTTVASVPAVPSWKLGAAAHCHHQNDTVHAAYLLLAKTKKPTLSLGEQLQCHRAVETSDLGRNYPHLFPKGERGSGYSLRPTQLGTGILLRDPPTIRYLTQSGSSIPHIIVPERRQETLCQRDSKDGWTKSQ
jgi:hypothetical protein